MSWGYLTHLLEEISNHSTFVGKLWLTLLIVFRIVLTVVGGESIYSDEQGQFVCNTLQPGCENVCYDAFAPLSHARFWVFQIIMITTPTILYLSFAMHKIARMGDSNYHSHGGRKRMPLVNQSANCQYREAEEFGEEDSMISVEIEPDKEKEKEIEVLEKHDGKRRIKQDGLMKVYVIQLLTRVVLEVAFLFGQYMLYGVKVPPSYECTLRPCPHTVDCFISRPTEKTIFLLIMYAVSALCLLLTLYEILHLCICDVVQTRVQVQYHHQLAMNSVYKCHMPSPPPCYHTALEKDSGKPGAGGAYNLGDFGHVAPGDKVFSQELYCLQPHLKPVKQNLDLVYQSDKGSSFRSSLNFKQASSYEKVTRV